MKYFILLTCFVLAASARQVREAATQSPLQEIEKHAAELQKTIGEQFNALVNSKNTQEVNKQLKEGAESVMQGISAFSNSLQAALADANGKAKETLEATQKSMQRTVEELRKAHPDVEKQAVEVREKLQAALQNTIQQSQKMAKEVAANVETTNKKLEPQLKEAYDQFSKQVQEIQKKLHEAATKTK